jgi:hypothetical protein
MDPITVIVTALALGAAGALKDVSSQAIKDANGGLIALIQRKYAQVPAATLTQLEEKPESKSRRL